MPIDYRDYPPTWRQLSAHIRQVRAGNRCEWCGAENGQPHPVTGSRVVLTVAHLGVPHQDGRPGDKHDRHDIRPDNLAALCQRCHLSYDRDDHILHAMETRARRAGQLLIDFSTIPKE